MEVKKQFRQTNLIEFWLIWNSQPDLLQGADVNFFSLTPEAYILFKRNISREHHGKYFSLVILKRNQA